jgi:hypothetical protein
MNIVSEELWGQHCLIGQCKVQQLRDMWKENAECPLIAESLKGNDRYFPILIYKGVSVSSLLHLPSLVCCSVCEEDGRSLLWKAVMVLVVFGKRVTYRSLLVLPENVKRQPPGCRLGVSMDFRVLIMPSWLLVIT